MTPGQIRLLRNSYPQIEPLAEQIGSAFYDKLFGLAPETRVLFGEDMSAQHAKFMSVVKELVSLHLRSLISLPVTMLNDSEAALPAIHMLGKRHAHLGVEPRHFDLMRTALMDTLGEVLGPDFTPDLRDAWQAAFELMANVMISGLNNAEAAGSQFLERLPEEAADETAATDFFASQPGETAPTPPPRSSFFDRIFRRT